MSAFALLTLVARIAFVAEPVEPAAQAPPVAAAEKLHQQQLAESSDALIKAATLALEQGDEPAAREALQLALAFNPLAALPPAGSARLPRLRQLLEEARSRLSHGIPDPAFEPGSAVQAAAGKRSPAFEALLRAVDALYRRAQFDEATAVLELAHDPGPLTLTERVQVLLRQGVLKMGADEAGARSAFWEALVLDRCAQLPEYAPSKTKNLFDQVKRTVPAPLDLTRTPSLIGPMSLEDPRQWGLIAGGGGLTLAAGGAMAGLAALLAFQDAERKADLGDGSYQQSLDIARTATNVADGFFISGGIALTAGALMYLFPGQVKVAIGSGPGRTPLSIGGSF